MSGSVNDTKENRTKLLTCLMSHAIDTVISTLCEVEPHYPLSKRIFKCSAHAAMYLLSCRRIIVQ